MYLIPVFLAKHELAANLPAFISTPAGDTRIIKLNLSIHSVQSVVSSRPISMC